MGCFSASQTTNEQVIPVERTMQTKTYAYIDTFKKKTYTAIYVLEMVVPNGTLHISTIKKLTIHNFVLKACHKASAAIRWVVAQLQQTHTSLGTFRSSGWTRGELGWNLPRAYTIDKSTNTKNWRKRYFLLMNQQFYWNLRRYPVDGWKLAEVDSLPQGWKDKFKPQLQKKLDAQCQAKTICT